MHGGLDKLGKPCTLLLDHRRARQVFLLFASLFAFANLLVWMFKILFLKVGIVGVLWVLENVS